MILRAVVRQHLLDDQRAQRGRISPALGHFFRHQPVAAERHGDAGVRGDLPHVAHPALLHVELREVRLVGDARHRLIIRHTDDRGLLRRIVFVSNRHLIDRRIVQDVSVRRPQLLHVIGAHRHIGEGHIAHMARFVGGTGRRHQLRAGLVSIQAEQRTRQACRHILADIRLFEGHVSDTQRQVEPHGEVGVAAATLEIEHTQRVLAGAEVQHLLACRHPLAIDVHVTSREVNVAAHGLMDAADVQHQIVVHEYPEVVIAGELIDDVFFVRRQLVLRQGKFRFHAHAEVVVEQGVKVHAAVVVILHRRVVSVERKESDRLCVHAGTGRGQRALGVLRESVLVQNEAVVLLVEPGIVFIAVIVIVTILIQLEQAVDVGVAVDGLTPGSRIEQVIEALIVVGTVQPRILLAVYSPQRGIHDARVGRGLRILSQPVAAVIAPAHELELMPVTVDVDIIVPSLPVRLARFVR